MSESMQEAVAPTGYGFWDRQLGLLGDREPLAVLAETPDALAQMVAEREEEVLARRAYPDKWSPREILGHLVDTEWVLGYRERLIRCEDRPSFGPVDQDLWVRRQGWGELLSSGVLVLFRALRGVTLAFWSDVGEEELARTGMHAGAGVEISLDLLLRIHAGHDLAHREQLARYLEVLDREA